MFSGPLDESLLKKALDLGLINVTLHDLRKYTHDKHHTADDTSYGGNPGMVMKPEPIFEAVKDLKSKTNSSNPRVILMCPTGEKLTQGLAEKLAGATHLIILCGRYEGVDERVRENLITEEISIGDYVLTGGELPALVLIDTIARMLPGVIGNEKSVEDDSFKNNLLDWPHYTRPEEFEGLKIPPVLKSGNHAEIQKWRRHKSLEKTLFRRPGLLAKAKLTEEDKKYLKEIIQRKV